MHRCRKLTIIREQGIATNAAADREAEQEFQARRLMKYLSSAQFSS